MAAIIATILIISASILIVSLWHYLGKNVEEPNDLHLYSALDPCLAQHLVSLLNVASKELK